MKVIIFSLFLLLSGGTSYAAQVMPIKQKVDSVLVCRSGTAYAYHDHECRGLAHCTHKIIKVTLEEARRMGFKPCKICYR